MSGWLPDQHRVFHAILTVMVFRYLARRSDLIDGVVKLMDSTDEVAGPVNLGNPREFTILELAQKVIDLTGSRSRIIHRPLPENNPKQRRPGIAQAKTALGWELTVSLTEGLRRTIPYFEALLSTLPPGLMVHER